MREASRADAPALAALARRCLAEAWSEASFEAALAAPGAAGWVIGAEGASGGRALHGYLLGALAGAGFEIQSFGVAPAMRRRGFARRLLQRALAHARAQGVAAVELEVRDGNRPAQALYAREGFAIVGRRPGYYGDGDDAVLLRRPLSAREVTAA